MINNVGSGQNSVQFNPLQKNQTDQSELKGLMEGKKNQSRWPNRDVAEISGEARRLAEEKQRLREAKGAAEQGGGKDDPDAGMGWMTVEATPDPEDPKNIAKARKRIVAQGTGRMPGM